MMQFQYSCSECGKTFPIKPEIMVCDECSVNQSAVEPLHGILEVQIEGKLPIDFNIHDLLPVEKEFFPGLPVGRTPCWEISQPKGELNHRVFVKAEMLNPTGSLKDRASYLVAAMARKHNIKNIVLASTGNAGSSMAGIGAASGLEIKLFLPASAPSAKLIQALQYGAEVVRIDGNYDAAYDASMRYVKKNGGLSRNTAFNPLTIEGKKTVALELFRQFNAIPDYIFVPVGDGVIISGVFKGFQDLKQLGLIEKVPTIIGVQSAQSDSLFQAWKQGNFSLIKQATTIADSIAVDIPRNGYYALQKIKAHSGQLMTVEDEDILSAQKKLSMQTGVFAEPAAASAYAGYLAKKDSLPKNSTVVLIITGNGLKDIKSANHGIKIPEVTDGSKY